MEGRKEGRRKTGREGRKKRNRDAGRKGRGRVTLSSQSGFSLRDGCLTLH